jgi:hypothetical protein
MTAREDLTPQRGVPTYETNLQRHPSKIAGSKFRLTDRSRYFCRMVIGVPLTPA